MKPNNAACGRGIRVIHKKSKVSKSLRQVACKYVHKPHLINGFKYDMRLYVLVTSYDPLRIYIFENGLVRFATAKYSISKKSLKKRFIHLTNYSVNKKAQNYVKSSAPKTEEEKEDEEEASKWDLNTLKSKLKEMGVNVDEAFKKVKDLCIKTIMSVEPHLASNYNRF